jgi:hypothetical protein
MSIRTVQPGGAQCAGPARSQVLLDAFHGSRLAHTHCALRGQSVASWASSGSSDAALAHANHHVFQVSESRYFACQALVQEPTVPFQLALSLGASVRLQEVPTHSSGCRHKAVPSVREGGTDICSTAVRLQDYFGVVYLWNQMLNPHLGEYK